MINWNTPVGIDWYVGHAAVAQTGRHAAGHPYLAGMEPCRVVVGNLSGFCAETELGNQRYRRKQCRICGCRVGFLGGWVKVFSYQLSEFLLISIRISLIDN